MIGFTLERLRHGYAWYFTQIITYYYQVLRTEHAIAQPLVMDKRLWLTSCASTQPHIFSEVFRATMTKFRSVPSSNCARK